MAWWQWIALGSVLLGAEMIVDAEFYLIFLGVSALIVGGIGLSPLEVPFWGQCLLFSGFAVASLVFFRGRVYGKIRGRGRDREEGVTGEVAIAQEAIEAGGVGRVELRGTVWTARNEGSEMLTVGARARVESMSGLTLQVRAE
jgi:membrane protein implicated in regulation of membrane protease activity